MSLPRENVSRVVVELDATLKEKLMKEIEKTGSSMRFILNKAVEKYFDNKETKE